MAVDLEPLDQALETAHLPALSAALVHLTGDTGWLRPEWRPTYTPLSRGETGVPEEEQAKMRAAAKVAITAYLTGKTPMAAIPAPDVLHQMMNFVAGAEIPEGYGDFLTDELAIDGHSTKDPNWTTPELKAAARKLNVLVVGAGMSGLLAAIRLTQAGVPFEIVDKNPDVGGTWLENTYPGCRVDSSNHIYSYSFEPNHFWPQHFSTQPVLLDYFRGVAGRYDIKKKVRFETVVEEMAWDEDRAVWKVRLNTPSGVEHVEANAVITAVGQLNRPRFPDIKGRESFKGPSFHSAEWRHDVDLAGKRVAVIGTGASAFQFVPEIVGKVASLSVFQRTPPWGFPVPHYHEDVPEGMNWLMEHVPFYDKWYRFWMFWMVTDGLLPMVTADPAWKGPTTAVSELNLGFREMIAAAIAAQAPDRPDLVAKIIPTYPPGGKRALLDNGVWLEALKRDNVELVTEGISEVTPAGIVTADGQARDFDVIIYGTGFHASKFLWPMKIKGRQGADLHETWAGDPRAYLGMTTPGFPNLFMIYGPNTNIVVNGSIVFFSECSVRYILGCLKLLAQTGAAAMEPKREVHDAFNIKVDRGNSLMAWGAPQVTSWYKNEAGRVTQNWPFALVDYWRATLAPDPQDFVLTKSAELVG
ncbi:NAD(P)/FAD-dependent oxidoreductase [Phenylobacterium sp. LH3H17]|uniref:flavin-containing monooxygenase n=1 Tax=Phenylobacterium sp. LH3H17 TaxID=2903901 RepID=UPI0020CA1937|nr:NAD(P)/FAD-dependent oxidoreductase [Phenylobacterium sp. LH3H17]UTP37648.1 NAD(P)/FAD-dependent oxidoreductase [Phenylobacterium sp. LH3H17]